MSIPLTILALEFRYRIFVSLGIVLFACVCAFEVLPGLRTLPEVILGMDARDPSFVFAAIMCCFASLLRMSAGTALRSNRIMSFDIRPERLVVLPPYTLVRNPIYLADILAATALSLCMPLPGILYPVLLYLHYLNLIRYEERELRTAHVSGYASYRDAVPRLFPSLASVRASFTAVPEFRIDHDGLRFNALYVLFVPGLLVSSITGEFFHAVLIGLPGVADWAYWHTRKGLHTQPQDIPL